MNVTRARRACIGLTIQTVCVSPVWAQWVEVDVDLQAGWNSVYLEVDPSPPQPDQLFDGLPVDAVWTRAPERVQDGPPNCADPNDPQCAPPAETGWWVWLAPSHPGRVASNLGLITGGKVYLIHATEDAQWTVTGSPNESSTSWRVGFNLVGFHVVDDPTETPTFADYLAPSGAHNGAKVFEVPADGSPSAIADPGSTRIVAGRGYWASSSADVVYDGPVLIDPSSLRGLDFALTIQEHLLVLENPAGSEVTATIAYEPSAPVPGSPADLPSLAGDVPLEWFDYREADPADQDFQWQPFAAESFQIAPSGTTPGKRTIRLAVDRQGLSGAVIDPQDGTGSIYQGLLKVTDGAGYKRIVGVRSQVSPTAGGRSASGSAGVRPGLYYGAVTVDKVAWVTAGAPVWTNDDPTAPELIGNPDDDTTSLRPVATNFAFPVILHLSDAGAYRMLTQVTMLWEPGDSATDSPGRFVLATPECPPQVCEALESGSVQDGQPFARRISSAAYYFDGDLTLSGGFDSALSGQTTMPQDHPLNPFHHGFHPDHDCNQQDECYEITRAFNFTFDAVKPAEVVRPGWGDSYLTGTYAESITGLHKSSVQVAGRFTIERVSMVATLNAQ